MSSRKHGEYLRHCKAFLSYLKIKPRCTLLARTFNGSLSTEGQIFAACINSKLALWNRSLPIKALLIIQHPIGVGAFFRVTDNIIDLLVLSSFIQTWISHDQTSDV